MAAPLCEFNAGIVFDLTDKIAVVADATVSKTLIQENGIKQILFALDTGQEMSTHAVPFPATVQILSGALSFTLGDDVHKLRAGHWLGMPADAPHSLTATAPTVFLLTLLQAKK